MVSYNVFSYLPVLTVFKVFAFADNFMGESVGLF